MITNESLNTNSRNYHDPPEGLRIFPSQNRAIDRVLTDLIMTIPAHFSLVTNVAGQRISSQGESRGLDLVVLGALVAGDLAASKEIARITGEYQDYQLILREGKRTHIFISEAGPHLVLFVQVRSDVPLGWARILILEAALLLEEIIASPIDVLESKDLDLEPQDLHDDFSHALEDLWLK